LNSPKRLVIHVMKLVAQQIAFTVTQPLTSVEFPKTFSDTRHEPCGPTNCIHNNTTFDLG